MYKIVEKSGMGTWAPKLNELIVGVGDIPMIVPKIPFDATETLTIYFWSLISKLSKLP